MVHVHVQYLTLQWMSSCNGGRVVTQRKSATEQSADGFEVVDSCGLLCCGHQLASLCHLTLTQLPLHSQANDS